MTATVTTIQDEIKTALDGLVADAPLPFVTRVSEVDSTEIPTAGTTADVVVGFEASTKLGRTTATQLEQHLVPVTIRRRFPQSSQAEMALNHSLAEYIRDAMADYHDDNVRVEQLLSPHPFDAPQAFGPGIYANKFVLDLDVLRSLSAITQDTSTPITAFTVTRNAIWDAIENWPEFTVNGSFVFARRFKTDADIDELALHDPSRFELPAITLTWGPTEPKFLTHIAESWPATVNVNMWFSAHQMELAEYRTWQVVRAAWQSKASGAPLPYVKTAVGRNPEKNSPIDLEIVELGRSRQLKAIKATVTFTIANVVSPMLD